MNWYSNLRIGNKLTVAFGSMLLAIFTLGAGAILGVFHLRTGIDEISDIHTPKILDCTAIRAGLNRLLVLTYMHIQEDSSQAMQEIEANLKTEVELVSKEEKEYKHLIQDSADKAIFELFRTRYDRFRAMQDTILELSRSNQNQAATEKLKSDLKPLFAEAIKGIAASVQYNVDVTTKAEHEAHDLTQGLIWSVLITSLLALAAGLFFRSLLVRQVARPLGDLVKVAQAIETGDLSQRIERGSEDEIGDLQKSFQDMSRQLSKSLGGIRNEADNLAAAAEEMSAVAADMGRTSSAELARAESLSTSSVEMNSSLENVATTTEQSSSNLERIAAAIEEMASSISEIARSAEHSRSSTRKAVTTVTQSSQSIGELSTASQEISKVVESIVEIAEQTKLLALNATIEAARAGEAGKGFAVVAGEVKELAKGTAEATEDIRRRIEAMQASTDLTISQIKAIHDVIGEVDALVGGIAAAVEEQSATTREIAGNANDASRGISEATRMVGKAALTSSDVSSSALALRGDSLQSNQSANQTRSTAEELTRMASNLKAQISKYKLA